MSGRDSVDRDLRPREDLVGGQGISGVVPERPRTAARTMGPSELGRLEGGAYSAVAGLLPAIAVTTPARRVALPSATAITGERCDATRTADEACCVLPKVRVAESW